jgi:Uma2 family endonuclease
MALPLRAVEFDQLYTSDDFEKLPEFNERYELIGGRLVKKPMPGWEHGIIADNLREALRQFDPERKVGRVLSDTSTKLGEKDTPLPALAFWTRANRPTHTKGAAPRPDLAVEVLSPHDLGSKKRLSEVQDKIRRYQAAGVSLIWVINPENQTVEVYYPDQEKPVQTLKIGDSLSGEPVLSGFTISLTTLFEYED